jgi:RHS repeat-associated protein
MTNVQTSFSSAPEAGDNLTRATHYFLADHLGTAQLELSSGGWPVWKGQFAPFGQELDTQYTANHYKFTGKERDTESGLDNFGARYYSSSMGRFSSPDPSGLMYADLTDPQSLNLYSYVRNNPLTNTDPTGMECMWDDGSYDSADDPDSGGQGKCSNLGGTWLDPGLFENAILTNGRTANIQRGDWSSQASSTMQQSWLVPSATVNGGPLDPTQTYSFNFGTMTRSQFISMMQQSGIQVSILDTMLGLHPGLNLRGSQSTCSIHATLAPFAGQYGNPVTGSFHIDEYNPLTFQPPSGGSPLNINGGGMQSTSNMGLHVTQDVIPDLKIQAHWGTWTGNQNCPHQ